MEKECGWYSYFYCSYSVSYLTLTAGDKGIECPSDSPKQCKEATVRSATVRHDGLFVSAALATTHRWLHSPPPRVPGRVPG